MKEKLKDNVDKCQKKLNVQLSRKSEEVGHDVDRVNVKKGSKGKHRAAGTKLNKTATDESDCETEIINWIFVLRSEATELQDFISMKLMQYSAQMDNQLESISKEVQKYFPKTPVTAEVKQKSLKSANSLVPASKTNAEA